LDFTLIFSSILNSGEDIMAKNSRGKRPCSICRKWFVPDVRQKGRQRTCGPQCRKELHRRQCEEWNRKHKAYPKNDYLAKKIENAVDQHTKPDCHAIVPQQQTNPVLPIEVIRAEYGIKPAIIIQYLVAIVINCTHERIRGFP
jgi:hypothetical protein